MNNLIKEYTGAMEGYDYQASIKNLHDFFWHDFCDHYLEYAKHRAYGEDEVSKKGALFTLTTVLENSLLLLAPIAPHITEEIYHDVLHKKDSIHLAKWPGEIKVEGAVEGVEVLNNIITNVRQHKASNRMPQNSELEKIIVTDSKENIKLLSDELLSEIKNIGKIKEIELKEGKEFNVSVL